MVIWCQTYDKGPLIFAREKTRCRHMGYSFRLAARVLLYAPSHRQDSTYHSLCYTSRGALAGTRNSSMCPPWWTHRTMSERSYHGATSRSWLEWEIAQCVHPMKDRSDDPSHHEWTLLPRSYISLQTRASTRSTLVTCLRLSEGVSEGADLDLSVHEK